MFEQERVLVRLQQYVLRQPEIQVCFLGGSFGRGQSDAYSDLDVALVYRDDSARETAYGQRRQIVRDVMPYLPARSFDASHVRPYLHIALYGNGAKVDFRFETLALAPTPWEREIRILKDSDGWGESFAADAARQAAQLPRPTIGSAELAELDSRFWVMFMDVYRLLLRGDHEKPFPIYLQLIYFTLPRLLELLPAEDPGHQGLIDLHFERDSRITAENLRRLFAAYLAARESVLRRHNLFLDIDRGFESAVQKLISRK